MKRHSDSKRVVRKAEEEINRRFDEQNKILEEQNIMIERLLKLLEVEE